MKRKFVASILGVAASLAVAASSYGQGQIYFANYTIGPDGPLKALVTIEGSGLAVGPSYTADLLYSLDGGNNWNLAAGSATSFSGTADGDLAGYAGYFFGGTVLIPGYTSGPVSFIVEAYNGTSFGNSLAKGQSAVFTLPSLAALGSPTPVGDLFNGGAAGTYLQAFSVVVPEPSSLALIGLGSTALFMFRRRK